MVQSLANNPESRFPENLYLGFVLVQRNTILEQVNFFQTAAAFDFAEDLETTVVQTSAC